MSEHLTNGTQHKTHNPAGESGPFVANLSTSENVSFSDGGEIPASVRGLPVSPSVESAGRQAGGLVFGAGGVSRVNRAPSATVTAADLKAGVQVVLAVAEAIREAGEVPSGHLYAALGGRLELSAFLRVVGILKGAGLVAESGHVLRWVGPSAEGRRVESAEHVHALTLEGGQ
jgi:hypothetical protein